MLQLKASFKNRPTTGRKRSTGTLLGGRGVVKGWWGGGMGRRGWGQTESCKESWKWKVNRYLKRASYEASSEPKQV